MLAREKRAREAAYRLIVKEEKARGNPITLKDARRIYKEQGLVEVLFERPKKYVRRKFVQIAPGKWRELQPGKPQREEYATGPIRDMRYLVRVRRMKTYWEFVHVISQEYRLTIKQARKRITRARKKGVNSRLLAGFLSGEYPISEKLLKSLGFK